MLEPGTIVGSYRVLAPLGRGTTAVVFAAAPVAAPGERVALKVARPGVTDAAGRARFLRGARAQAALTHPAIVGVQAVGEDPRHGPWVAMDLVDGPTLAELHVAGALTATRALALLDDVAGGLDRAHAAGVVHRDVKPANVLVSGADRALLADFGLARDAAAATRSGAVIGTLPYLAPEVVRGGEPSPAGDRYAFAALAYELLVGETVFPRPTDAAVMFAHVDEPVPAASRRRPELPRAIDSVLERGLAKDPARRFPSAASFVAALRAALAGADLPAPAPRGDASAPTAAPDDGRAWRGRAAWSGRRRLAPGGGDRLTRRALLGGLAVVGVAGGVLALSPLVSDRDGGPARAAVVPAPAPGRVALGSALEEGTVVGRDCRDGAPSGSSPACTLLQTELPGRQLVVPSTGAIRAWTVRGARGELVLQILRRRDDQIFQVVRSQPVIATGATERFGVALAARAGDLVAIALAPGAQAGVVADVAGAATERWSDPVSSDRGPGTRTGFAHELQLRVDFEPGAVIAPPEQVTGRAAAALPDGREVAAGDVALPDGRRVRIALVELGEGVYVDLYRGARRRARSRVPDLVAGGSVVEFKPFRSAGNPSQLNVAWRNPGTRGEIYHYFGLDAEALEYYS